MQRPAAILLGIGLTLMIAGVELVASSAHLQEMPSANQNGYSKMERKPVVVELFTSEGCSSCPPADLLLQKLVASQTVPGAEVIALEEHVDYWNHQGWTDPYSSPEWTRRQQDYAAFFKGDPYTPQAVVDGRSQFVGNDAREAALLIEKAASQAKTEVVVTVTHVDSRTSQLHVSVAKLANLAADDAAEVWLAVTEDGLHSTVTRGENAGHTLPHIATLRSLRKIGVVDAKGSTTSFTGDPVVKFDSHWDVAKLSGTVFVQRKKSREIIGAASTMIQLPNGNATGTS